VAERGEMKRRITEMKLEEQRNIKSKEQLKYCTFHPKINNYL